MGGSHETRIAMSARGSAPADHRMWRQWRARLRSFGAASLAGLVIAAGPAGAAHASASDTSSSTPSTTAPSTPSSSTPTAPTSTTSIIVRTVAGLSAADAADAITSHGGTETSAIAALNMHMVDVASSDATTAIAAYRADARVASVSADGVRAAETAASDPSYGNQWSLPKIGWDNVHGVVAPAGSATVAVLDTGVNASTPDLAGRLVPGWSFDGSDPTTDANGHGTHGATIAAGATDDGNGIAGVAYAGVHVMPVRVLGADGTGNDSDIIQGLVWAADHGADVALMAFSNPGRSSALQAAVDYAWSKGVIVVAAAGNDGTATASYPAGLTKVVGVGATDQHDAIADFSNQSDSVFIAAPGVGIDASGVAGVTAESGTSASAAIVAGAAALMRAIDPSASNATIIGRLARNTDTVTGGNGGNGRINLDRAINDTSSTGVTPAGSSGGGGPVVGPYVAAAITLTVGTQTPSPVPAGTSATFTVSAQSDPGQNNDTRMQPSDVTGLPSGATASFSGSACRNTGSGGTVTWTMTITTTGTTPVGTTTMTLNGERWNGASSGTCSGGTSGNQPTTTKSLVVSAGAPAPTVTAVAPASGPTAGGTSVTITGTNLTGASAVKFGATNATSVVVVNSTTITATAPAGTVNTTVDVTVTTAGGTSATNASDKFTYAGTPTVTGINPVNGGTAGGTSVAITGTNFSAVSAVKFGAVNATSFTVNSATSITATAPAGTLNTTADVTVTNSIGTSATSAADQFTWVAAPTVTAVNPVQGPTAGGTATTITGTNFFAGATVKFGANNATS
ncbi:MAG: hypothetical protein JWL83_85, partial [Actinomycetia bacterium]|nr:hypothetical protein [Actinomycetes bacterium]